MEREENKFATVTKTSKIVSISLATVLFIFIFASITKKK
jgi:hypothetical protein